MADVLVIGAGPTGLMMALELVRQGISCRVIDRSPSPSTHSKALAIQARTLEIFAHLGIVERFLAEGLPVRAMNPSCNRKQLSRIEMTGLDSTYAFILSLEQSKTERILIETLSGMGIEVERECELLEITESNGEVNALIRDRMGKEAKSSYAWAIGCDGAHSAVRKQLSFPFEGKAFSDIFSLADVAIENWPFPHDEAALFLDRQGIVGAIPMPGPNRYRLIFQLERCRKKRIQNESIHGPISSAEIPDPIFEEAKECVARAAGPVPKLLDPLWLANFHIHSRLTRDFRKGRIFIAGDAAHIHSPAGGQGMNTGIQDAFNLGWKLALVHRGQAPQELLDTYTLERRCFAKRLLQTTAAATHLATLQNSLAIAVRNRLIACLTSIPFVRKQIISHLSQTAIRSPKSLIVLDSSCCATGPKAGTRLPNARFIGKEGPVDLDGLLKKNPSHHLLIFTGPRPTVERMGALIQFAASKDFPIEPILIAQSPEFPSIPGILSVTDPDGAAHAQFGAKKETMYLIRPDLVIGCRTTQGDIQSYMRPESFRSP